MNMVTLRGPALPGGIDLHKLNDFEAGIAFLGQVVKTYPGITMNELFAMGRPSGLSGCGGWCPDFVSNIVGSVADSLSPSKVLKEVGSLISQAIDYAGSVESAATSQADKQVKLFASPQVSGAIAQGIGAYFTGGASLGSGGLMDWISSLGASFKKNSAPSGSSSLMSNPWVLGGAAVVGLWFVMSRR